MGVSVMGRNETGRDNRSDVRDSARIGRRRSTAEDDTHPGGVTMATWDDELCDACGYHDPVSGLTDPAGLTLRRSCEICRVLDIPAGGDDDRTRGEDRHVELLRAVAWIGNRLRADVRAAAMAGAGYLKD
jgi:hypothetical protein